MPEITRILMWVTGSCLVTELLAYWLHRLLHSGRIAFLSRNHMRHHLVIYGPMQNQRSTEYRDATTDSVSLGNIGLEWLLPSALLLASAIAVFHFLHVSLACQLIVLGTSLLWGFLMFSCLHDVMHIEGYWMEKSRWLSGWFTSARKLHDIHHQVVNSDGFMDKNFGIGFFFFDRLFGTLCSENQTLDEGGYKKAIERFRVLWRKPCRG